jgi:hypothetical protein
LPVSVRAARWRRHHPRPFAAAKPQQRGLRTENLERIVKAADERSQKVARAVAQSVVKAMLPQELGDLQVKLSERLDKIQERVTGQVLQVTRSEKNYVAVLERHIQEAHEHIIKLERDVAELKARLR